MIQIGNCDNNNEKSSFKLQSHSQKGRSGMKKMLLVTSFFLSLMICFTSSGWASAYDENKAGEAAAMSGDYDKAIRLFTKAIESGELSQEGLSGSYYNRGLAWFAQRDNDRAIADFTKAIPPCIDL